MQTLHYHNKEESYEKGRPSYPKEVYAYLTQKIEGKTDIADIGAGTGLFTKGFCAYPVTLSCIEKDEGMLLQCQKNLPGVKVLRGCAEKLPLPDHSQDLITAATAFHWFDSALFRQECQRVLRPEGLVALLWNNMDYTCPILQAQTAINQKLCPRFHGYRGLKTQTKEIFSAFFKGDYETKLFDNPLLLDQEAYLRRALSSSYAPTQEDAVYTQYVEETNAAFARFSQNGLAAIGMQTACYSGRV